MSLVKGLLLVKTLDFFIHGINEQILALLGLFKVDNVLFSTVSSASSDSNLRLHHFVVFFNLLQGSVELIKLFLGFEDTLKLLISLLLLAFILALENLVLTFGFDTVSLHDVIVIVSSFKGGLHASKLMLNSIELHTGLFAGHADLADLFILLAKLQVNTLMSVSELLCKGVLKTTHERMVGGQESFTGIVIVLVDVIASFSSGSS